MKRTIKIAAAAAVGIIAASCSHQFQTVADGKVFRIGNASCNLLYVDGILVSTQVRENASAEVETSDDDEAGATASIKAKGVRKVVFRQGPIVSGYLQELAETSPEAAKAYVEQFPDITKAVFEKNVESEENAVTAKIVTAKAVTAKAVTAKIDTESVNAKIVTSETAGGSEKTEAIEAIAEESTAAEEEMNTPEENAEAQKLVDELKALSPKE